MSDEEYALKLQEEMKRQVEAEDEASLALALQLKQEIEDEKFAAQLKRLFDGEEKKKKDALESDMRAALKLQQLEEKEFQKKFDLERKEREFDGPFYWVCPLLKNEKYRRVRLPPNHEVYRMVEEKFTKCGRKIQTIEYVQNERTWKNYINEKRRQKTIKEVWRFHGTPHTNVDGISENGLLTSKDQSGGGTTIWSAEDPNVSVGYSQRGPAPDGTLYMFLCRVLSNMAQISTVQNGALMYPEFLIAYQGVIPQPIRLPKPKVVAGTGGKKKRKKK